MPEYQKSSFKLSNIFLIIIAVIGLTFTITLFLFEQKEWRKTLEIRFQNLTMTMVSAFQRELRAHSRELDSVRRFYDGSIFVDPIEFSKFTMSIVSNFPEIQAVGWIPLVDAEDLEEHVEAALDDGLINYKINPEVSAQGDILFPIFYVEPMAGNETIIGFDLASDPQSLSILEKAWRHGKPLISKDITLFQKDKSMYSYYEFVPVYHQNLPGSTVGQSYENLLGFVFGIFWISETITAALESFDISNFDIFLTDFSVGLDSSLLYSSNSIAGKQSNPADRNYDFITYTNDADLKFEKKITVGGRQWSFLITARPEFYTASGFDKKWLILISGLFITTLLFLLVYNLQIRAARVEVLVKKQTIELRNSESRLRTITGGSPALIFMLDHDGSISYINRVWDMQKQEDVLGMNINDFFIPTQRKDFHEALEQVFKKREMVEIETTSILASGSAVHYLNKLSLLEIHNEPDKIIMMSTDITFRKKVEEEKENKIKRVQKQQEAVIQIAGIDPSDLDFYNLMENITEYTALGIDAERISIWLFDDTHTNLICQDLFLVSNRKHSRGKILDMSSYPAYSAAMESTIIADDVLADERTSDLGPEYLIPIGITSMLDIPLHKKGRVEGVLCIEHIGKTREWIEDECIFIERIADQIESILSEIELKESRQHLAIAQEIAHLGSWELDLISNKSYWSDEVYRILGLEPELSILNYQTFLECVHSDDRMVVSEAYSDSIEKGKNHYEIEHRIVCKNTGELRFVHEKCTHIRNHSGNLVRSVGMVHDITKKKLAEQELHRLRNYLSNIIDSMPSILVGVDRNGIVTQWNKKAEHTAGLSSDDAVGQPLGKAIPFLAGEMKRVSKAITSGEQQRDLNRVRYENGERCIEEVTVYPLIANGVQGAVIRVDDITDQVRIEEMMVQSEKMMSVGGLAAGMAHEINNPLAGMIQTSEVVINRLTGKLPANNRAAEKAGLNIDAISAYMNARDIPKLLGRIRSSGIRAAEIITNMLNFARKSTGTFSLHNMAAILDQSADLCGTDYDLKKKYDFRQIEIVREYDENIPAIPCEAGKIQQVIMNILRNGAEAMQEDNLKNNSGKTPCFILRLVNDQLETGMVRIEIEDNGPGMEEKIRKRIFDPFYTTKPTNRGTGLGLSVSYFIITENHKGLLSVESNPGEGTKFIISLPVEKSDL